MNLPVWVQEALRKFEAPFTGKVVIELELYNNGVTKMSIGSILRHTPDKSAAQYCEYCARPPHPAKPHSREYIDEIKMYRKGKLAGEPAFDW